MCREALCADVPTLDYPVWKGAKAMRVVIIVERIRANLWRSGGECTGRAEFRAHATEPVAQR